VIVNLWRKVSQELDPSIRDDAIWALCLLVARERACARVEIIIPVSNLRDGDPWEIAISRLRPLPRVTAAQLQSVEPFSIALSLFLSAVLLDLFLPLVSPSRDNVSLIPGNPKRGRRGRSRTTGVDLHDRARRTDCRPHRSSILGWVWI